jgi:hypothetical protein
LFNRASEEDEVLRRQSFSVLTVEVDSQTGDVDKAKDALGKTLGSSKAIVVPGKIDYKTPDQTTNTSLRDNQRYLVEEMFRAAHVRTRRDSLAAESAESIRLQYTELNEMLQGMAKSLEMAEQQIARAWFAWSAPTPEAGEQAFRAADIVADYPDEFFLDDLVTDLEGWAEGIRMHLGETMTKRIKKRAVRRIDPDIPPLELDKIDQEIDAMKDEDVLLPESVANPPDVPAEVAS